ncbi:hypothetical protein RIF29_11201 [Crotalaria pallida]|uniref:Uncharacterized protein n=1 Tax=Crotalaria pallida TaxID=3830 RepID=A0AAN9ILW1_CROPI
MKEVEEHKTEWAKHRNKIFSLQLERDDWMNRAKITRERFHSHKKESEHQIAVQESIAEKKKLEEHIQILEWSENVPSDLQSVGIAESRAAFAEVAVWTDNSGKPVVACAICLTNEKNLAFGCRHMHSHSHHPSSLRHSHRSAATPPQVRSPQQLRATSASVTAPSPARSRQKQLPATSCQKLGQSDLKI